LVKLLKKIVLGAFVTLALVAAVSGTEEVNWGPTHKAFEETCAAKGGTIHGMSYGATCSYDGGVTTGPARNPEWTVTVADGSVATWLGGGKVIEKISAGTVVVACHDREGQRVPLWQDLCALP
jgi:hypothetical protein